MFINIYRNSKTQNWFKYETFYYLFEFKLFQHEERETQFLSTLTFPSEPDHMRPPQQTTGLALASSKNCLACLEFKSQLQHTHSTQSRLASPKSESQLTVFFQIPKSSALPGMTSFTYPVHFLSEVFIVTSDCHIRPVRVWTPALN